MIAVNLSFAKPLLSIALLAALSYPVYAAEPETPAAIPSERLEDTTDMPVVWRDLYAKVLGYPTEHNLADLNETYTARKRPDGDDIQFTYLFGYELNDEAGYLVSPDGMYEFYTDEAGNVESTQAIDLGERGIYLTYGSDPSAYQSAGFPCMPDFYYSLAANGECYLHQRELGYPYGCCPTSLSMAMKLSGEMDFDYEGFFSALRREGYSFQTKGITLPDALNSLSRYTDLSKCYFYREYNPFDWMEAVLEGRPVVICIENGLDLSDGNFVKPARRYMTGYHAELITGFFVCDGRLGFELYDPDPIGWTGQGVLMWESDLWSVCKNEVNGGFFSAISFRLEDVQEVPEKIELTLQEQGKLHLMYQMRTTCTERESVSEQGPVLVDAVYDFPAVLVS